MWLAVDENSDEYIYNSKPFRGIRAEDKVWDCNDDRMVILPKGTIKRLLNYPLTWDDEAQEIKEYKEGK